jgi:hypothetical protein
MMSKYLLQTNLLLRQSICTFAESVDFDKLILLQVASCPPFTELEGSLPQTLFHH